MSIEIISLFANLVLGGGFLATLMTLRAMRKKAGAEAKGAEANAESTELDNVEKAIKIWREMAEDLKVQRDDALKSFGDVSRQMMELKKEVQKLNSTNCRILKLLDRLSPENMENLIAEIKHEIQGTS